MEIEFEDKKLALIETDDAGRMGWSVSVVNSCRKKLDLIRAAPDERTLRNWKSLHYEKLKGANLDERSIRINDQWRLILRIGAEDTQPKVTILRLEDYH